MAQLAYDTLLEAEALESQGVAAEQAKAIVGTVARGITFTQQVAEDLEGLSVYVQANMATKDDLAEFKAYVQANMATKKDLRDMVTQKDLRAAIATLHADISHHLLVLGFSLGALIMALGGVVVAGALA